MDKQIWTLLFRFEPFNLEVFTEYPVGDVFNFFVTLKKNPKIYKRRDP